MRDGNYPLSLFYDASCPLCRREIEFLLARDELRRLVAVDVSSPGFANDTGVPMKTLLTMMHGRRPDGTILQGAEVFRLAYGAAGLAWVAGALSWPALAPFWNVFFAFVGHHRNRFPDWLSAAIFGRDGRRGACRDGRCSL